jgi:hypothetical protein
MANRKISDLTALTAPATGDLLPIVDISEAAAADKNKKITYGELLASAPAGSAAAPSFSFDGDPNTGIFNPAADTLAFADGGAEAMRIDSSARLLVGLTSANTSGAKLQTSDGLTFPATAVASADPNTLDDYEEGTFTPTVVGHTTAGTASYATQVGSYVKIGQQVTVQLYISYTGGTGTGNLRVSGLPFTSGNVNNRIFTGSGVLIDITTTALTQTYISIIPNVAFIGIDQFPLGGGTPTSVSYDAAGGIVATIAYCV